MTTPATQVENRAELLQLIKLSSQLYGKLHYRISETLARKNRWLTMIIILFSVMIIYFSASGISAPISARLANAFGAQTQSSSGASNAPKATQDDQNAQQKPPASNAASAPKDPSPPDFITGTIGALMVVLSACQYFLRYEERHLTHNMFGADYMNLFRKAIRLEALPALTDELVHSLNKELNKMGRYAPAIPNRFWKYEKELAKALTNLEYELAKRKAQPPGTATPTQKHEDRPAATPPATTAAPTPSASTTEPVRPPP